MSNQQAVRGPTLSHVLDNQRKALMNQLNVSAPGEIVTYDGKYAEVRITVQRKMPDGTYSLPPILTSVPVIEAGSSTDGLRFPIRPGDGCVVFWADRSLDDWWTGTNAPVSDRTHSYNDCYCIVGLRRPGVEFGAQRRCLQWDDARTTLGPTDNFSPRIAVSTAGAVGGSVQLGVGHGETATEAVILGTTFSAAFDAFITALKASTDPATNAAAIALETALIAGYTSQVVKTK